MTFLWGLEGDGGHGKATVDGPRVCPDDQEDGLFHRRKDSTGGFTVCRTARAGVAPYVCDQPLSLRLLLTELLLSNPHRQQNLKTVQCLPKTQFHALNFSAAEVRTDRTWERASGLLGATQPEGQQLKFHPGRPASGMSASLLICCPAPLRA